MGELSSKKMSKLSLCFTLLALSPLLTWSVDPSTAWKSVNPKHLATMMKLAATTDIAKKFHHGFLLQRTPEKKAERAIAQSGSCMFQKAIELREQRALEFYPTEFKEELVACCSLGDIGKCVQDLAPAYEQVVAAEELTAQKGKGADGIEDLAAKALAHLLAVAPPRLNGSTLTTSAEMHLVILEGLCKIGQGDNKLDVCEAAKVFEGVAKNPAEDEDEDDEEELSVEERMAAENRQDDL